MHPKGETVTVNTQKPHDPVFALSQIAPVGVGELLQSGPGFSTEGTSGPIEWKQVGIVETGADTWEFSYESAEGLSAVCTLQLDRDYRAASYQVKLANNSGSQSPAFSNLWALALNLSGVTGHRVLGSTGCSGRWWCSAREYPPDAFQLQWMEPIHPRPVWFENSDEHYSRRGDSSAKTLPLFMFSPSPEWEAPGFFWGLEWTAGWHTEVTFAGSPDAVRVVSGPKVDNLLLDEGESLELPVVHLGFFEGGFDGGGNACRRYIRDRITPRYEGQLVVPPVNYTLWPGIEAPYTVDDVYPQVEVAAESGVEMFVVDNDWFPLNFRKGLGNWYVDPEKFPQGLEPVAEYVRSKGMGLGLAIHPEIACPGTRMIREHPEFFYDLPSIRPTYVYNYGMPEARDYLVELISGLVERYDLRFIRGLAESGPGAKDGKVWYWEMLDPTGKAQFAHVQGLYRILEALLSRHPKLMLELCCGGGNRMDLGCLKRHHTCWFSDQSAHPHVVHAMQLSASTFLPAHYLYSGFGAGKGGSIRGGEKGLNAASPDLPFISRMAGGFLLYGRIAEWPAAVRERARHWIKVFKKIRHLLVQDYYRLLPAPQTDSDWDAGQFCDGTAEGVVFVFRYSGVANYRDLSLRSLDPQARYKFRNEGNGAERLFSGEQLLSEGFRVELAPNEAEMWSYKML